MPSFRAIAVVRLAVIFVGTGRCSRIRLHATPASLGTALEQIQVARSMLASLDVHGADLEPTFRYPETGMLFPTTFDIRPEVCIAAGGARHGDIVISEDDLVGTVIGVRRTRAFGLLVHMEGSKTASTSWERKKLRVVARASVPEGGSPIGAAPSAGVRWLAPTFRYKAGLEAFTVERFDIRDEVCLKVGGFRHGQVVQADDGKEMVAIGVRQDARSGRTGLWFHPRGAEGAAMIPFYNLSSLRWVSTEFVPEHGARQPGNRKSGNNKKYKGKKSNKMLPEPQSLKTLQYPAGAQDPVVEEFDISRDACMAAGGALHGDVVLFQDGTVGTVVGVGPLDGQPVLWTHIHGDEGASAVEGVQLLRVVSTVSVPEAGLPAGAAPSAGVQWLAPTFFFKAGLESSKVQKFDIRDEVCLKVGGFRHGQIVAAVDGRKMVVIGVRQDTSDGRVALWAQPLKEDGAIVVPFQILSALRWVSTQVVPEHVAPLVNDTLGELSLERTFQYPCGVVKPHVQGFDIRPEVCMRVGGALHGDIVLAEDGGVATVVGVQEDASGAPRLWLHREGRAGAGFFEDTAEELRIVSKAPQLPEGGLPGCAAPSTEVTWLQPTFRYLLEDGTEAMFDIRDQTCLSVGGFTHGQVVQVAATDAIDLVVIGVRSTPANGEVALYVSRLDEPMATRVTFATIRAMRAVGSRSVQEHNDASNA